MKNEIACIPVHWNFAIAIFKTITISKTVFQAFIATVSKHTVIEIEKIEMTFFLNNSFSKIKYETLCNDYRVGRLTNVDIPNKIIALQCFSIRRLYDNSFHEWKLIPPYLIEKSFDISFIFHSNLLFKSNKFKFFLSFYRETVSNWKKCLAMITEIPSCILWQYPWYNGSIQVDNASVYFLKFSKKTSIIFRYFFVTMDPLNNGMNLRQNTAYMKVFVFNGYN